MILLAAIKLREISSFRIEQTMETYWSENRLEGASLMASGLQVRLLGSLEYHFRSC
jgi:hypothetical protein